MSKTATSGGGERTGLMAGTMGPEGPMGVAGGVVRGGDGGPTDSSFRRCLPPPAAPALSPCTSHHVHRSLQREVQMSAWE
jgi:hypothetical protein